MPTYYEMIEKYTPWASLEKKEYRHRFEQILQNYLDENRAIPSYEETSKFFQACLNEEHNTIVISPELEPVAFVRVILNRLNLYIKPRRPAMSEFFKRYRNCILGE